MENPWDQCINCGQRRDHHDSTGCGEFFKPIVRFASDPAQWCGIHGSNEAPPEATESDES